MNTVFMLTSVLDANKKWQFFNTFGRRVAYFFKHKLLGRDTGVGRWWTQKEIEEVARENGYASSFIRQNPDLYTSHYRFDVVLTRVS